MHDLDAKRAGTTGIGAHLDRAITAALAVSTATLVVAEVVILFVGILARYVFHRPLVWSDELASILFLWLAVLGSALAFSRGENLRMTTLVNRFPPAARRLRGRSRLPQASPSWR
jgi:TRAP-type C4-dicarboxylate transport system permease small subunit